uniref:Uncharacterized protein n=1 Tax=Cacopsylla melanoneura TaxID=428564 RepID=A0A8D8VWQ3_9HEMI
MKFCEEVQNNMSDRLEPFTRKGNMMPCAPFPAGGVSTENTLTTFYRKKLHFSGVSGLRVSRSLGPRLTHPPPFLSSLCLCPFPLFPPLDNVTPLNHVTLVSLIYVVEF